MFPGTPGGIVGVFYRNLYRGGIRCEMGAEQ